MTEAEAKTKWCPFARVENDEHTTAVNRGHRERYWSYCIGSNCMAWRRWASDREQGECGLARP